MKRGDKALLNPISLHLFHYSTVTELPPCSWFPFFWVQIRAAPIILHCLLQAHRAPYVLPFCLNPRFGGHHAIP